MLCDPPEAEGYGKDIREVMEMTFPQVNLFMLDKKLLKTGSTVVSSFKEAVALRKAKKSGKQTR